MFGIMGNLLAESALDPTNLENRANVELGMSDAEYTAKVDSGEYADFDKDKNGYGIAQWTYYTRKRALRLFMEAAGLSIGDLNGQLQFLVTEIRNDFGVLNHILKNAKTIEEASDAFVTKFERPYGINIASEARKIKAHRAALGRRLFVEISGKPDVYAPVTPAEPRIIYCTARLPLMGLGRKDDLVGVIQAILDKREGPHEWDEENEFGLNTKRAVAAFQKAHGLASDGIVGSDTWNRLLKWGEKKT